jgi:competence protein ComEA
VSAINSDGKVNINIASMEELDKLPGVGPVTAQKILDYREKNGEFNSIEDLKNIQGIGDKTLDKFRDNIDIR